MATSDTPSHLQTFEGVFGQGKEGAGQLKDLYWNALDSIRVEMQDYWLNHAFLHGYQWLYFSEVTGQLDEIPEDPERVQATVNKMWPSTRTIISTLMQRHLSFEVPPREATDAHIRGAKLAESVLRAVHQEHSWETLREDVYYAVWKGGTAAMCVDWDPDAGDILDRNVEGGSPIKSGDTYEQHLSITQFVVEPGSVYPETARYWFKSLALPPAEVQKMFDLEDKPPADATAGLSPFQKRSLSLERGHESEIVDLTLVLTYYERPSDQNPEGRHAILVDNEFVHDGPWPFPFKDRLNLVIMRETPKENRWTGDTVLTAARPVQTLLNAAWSSIAEHMKLAGNARLLVPVSSIEIMDDITDLPGEIVPYNDALPVKPSYLTPPVMPEWWITMPMRLGEEMDDILGVHDISRGQAPANIESGFGLTILAEKDNTPVSRLSKETSGAFGRLASMVLAIYEHETKKTKITRKSLVNVPGSTPLTVVWNGEDFKGATYAYVPEDAVLPRSRAAQMEMAKDMLAAGLIESVEDFMAVAELPGQRDILTAVSPDVDRARRENAGFSLGRQSVPQEFDNHKAHIHEHNKYRKTIDYEMLSDEDRQMVDDHVRAHDTLAAKEVGNARARSNVDPALGMAPTAAEGPQVPPLPPPDGPPIPGSAPPPMPPMGLAPTPEDAASDIMSLMQQLGG